VHHRKTALDPEFVGSCHRGDSRFDYLGQGGLEAVDVVEHTIGVPDGKLEQIVYAGVQPAILASLALMPKLPLLVAGL
jgi:hypothetical protein